MKISKYGVLVLVLIFGINVFGCANESNINGEWVFGNAIIVSDDLDEWYNYLDLGVSIAEFNENFTISNLQHYFINEMINDLTMTLIDGDIQYSLFNNFIFRGNYSTNRSKLDVNITHYFEQQWIPLPEALQRHILFAMLNRGGDYSINNNTLTISNNIIKYIYNRK